jgi:hypothetical protein
MKWFLPIFYKWIEEVKPMKLVFLAPPARCKPFPASGCMKPFSKCLFGTTLGEAVHGAVPEALPKGLMVS